MRLTLLTLLVMNVMAHATAFERFEEHGRVGLKNNLGQIVLPADFEALGWSDGTFSLNNEVTGFKLNGKWGLITIKNKYITPAAYETLIATGYNRLLARKNISAISAKTGCLAWDGRVTIPFVYDAISLFGLRAVVMEKRGAEYVFGLTDLENKTILPLKFNNIYPVGSLRFAVENAEGKLALFTDRGEPITDFSIDSIGAFYRDKAIVFSQGLQGLVNREGELIAKPQYARIDQAETIRALLPGEWKVLSTTNEVLQSIPADVLEAYSDNKFKITRGGLQGLIDSNLQFVWPLQYQSIGSLLNHRIAVKRNAMWGLLDETGEAVLSIEFDSLVWDGAVAIVKKSQNGSIRWHFADVETKRLSVGYDQILKVSDKHKQVWRQGFVGLVTSTGKELLHCVYDSILEIRQNQIAVKFKGQYGIVSLQEHWLMPPQPNRIQLIQNELYMERAQGVRFVKTWSGDIIYFTSNALKSHTNVLEETLPDGTIKWLNFSGQEIKLNSGVLLRSTELPQHKSPVENFYDGLQRFQSQGKFGFRDQQGRLIIPNRYDSAQHFSEGLAAFKLLGKWGFLDVQDKIVINPSFERVDPFSQGYARVYNKGKYGLIDKKGHLQLSLQYDSIQRAHNYWVIYQNKLVGLATQSGRVVIQPRYQSIQLLPNQQVLVELNDKLGVITMEGLSIVPVTYHTLHFDANKQVFLAYELPNWVSLD